MAFFVLGLDDCQGDESNLTVLGHDYHSSYVFKRFMLRSKRTVAEAGSSRIMVFEGDGQVHSPCDMASIVKETKGHV